MARSRLSLIAVSLAVAGAIAAIPARAIAFAIDWVERALFAVDPRAIVDAIRGSEGPALALAGGPSIEPSLATSQRHEAGLARLGSVRHNS